MLKKLKKKKISIIIPIYNGEKTLNRCVNSILKQNFPELEILLINDTSKDNSIKICQTFKKKINNIKFFNNKKNVGVSLSRNIGIKKAKGDFLIFLDSDDYLLKKSLNWINKLIDKNNKKDLLISNKFISINMLKVFVYHKLLNKKNLKIKSINRFIRLLNNEKNTYGNIYNYIINRNFLVNNKIGFTANVSFGEDQEFVAKILSYCKNFFFFNKPFYCYCSGAGNLSDSMSYNAGLSCLKVSNNLILLKELKLLSKEKRLYIKKVINKLLKQFIARLICSPKKNIFKFSSYIKRNKKNFNFMKFKFLDREIFRHLDKHGYNKGLISYKILIVSKFLAILKISNYSKIFIFCYNYYGIAISKILLQNNYNVQGFLDNNKLLKEKKIFNLKVYSPNKLKSKSSIYKSKINIIISNQFIRNVKNITNQLVKLGIKKKQIVKQNFFL